jgi:predicted Zn finger-like uncharacterized protein
MPLTGPIPEGRSFFCPHCGALYAVTHSRLSKSDSNVAKCVVCGKIMDQRESIRRATVALSLLFPTSIKHQVPRS